MVEEIRTLAENKVLVKIWDDAGRIFFFEVECPRCKGKFQVSTDLVRHEGYFTQLITMKCLNPDCRHGSYWRTHFKDPQNQISPLMRLDK